MAELRAARRYATAVFDVAVRQNQLEVVERDISLIGGLWNSTPQLAAAMSRPQIPIETKERIWEQLLQGRVSPLTAKFIRMLLD